jgi:hypothetical protein
MEQCPATRTVRDGEFIGCEMFISRGISYRLDPRTNPALPPRKLAMPSANLVEGDPEGGPAMEDGEVPDDPGRVFQTMLDRKTMEDKVVERPSTTVR